jgi:Cleft lip and palate transmembrane protein 1 (CLPTM1)
LNIVEQLKESSSPRRRVAPELARYEDERLARLEAVGPSAPPLRCLWPPGTPFELFVYLSDRADHVTVFAGASKAGNDLRLIGELKSIGEQLPNSTFTHSFDEAYSSELHAPPLLFHAAGLRFGRGRDKNEQVVESSSQHINLATPTVLQRNGTLYAHLFAVADGASPDPLSSRFTSKSVVSYIYPLVKHLKKRPRKQTFSLLGDDSGAVGDKGLMSRRKNTYGNALSLANSDRFVTSEEADEVTLSLNDSELFTSPNTVSAPAFQSSKHSSSTTQLTSTSELVNETRWLPYWRPALRVQLVLEHGAYAAASMPPHMRRAADVLPDLHGYRPFLYMNDFFLLDHHLVGPLNDTVASLPLEVSVQTVGPTR